MLFKLNELYNEYEGEEASVMEDACSKRIDDINQMAIKHCQENGIELKDVAGEKNHSLKHPINLK